MNKYHLVRNCLSAITLFLLAACEQETAVPEFSFEESFPAGKATSNAFRFNDLMSPAGNMALAAKPDFYAGKALANQPWVKAPSITDARDGLGPLFNARSCLACHVKGGRSKLPSESDQLLFGPLVRVSIPASDSSATPSTVPEPTYGDQIQTSSIGLQHQLRHAELAKNKQSNEKNLPAEADIYISWEYSTYTYPDGSIAELRRPVMALKNLGYGPLHSEAQLSLRNAPAIAGMGLLEAISDEDILALADSDDLDKDGISGKANWVFDQSIGEKALGRFGLKSNRASVLDTVASAFASDIGLSNPVYPVQPCTENQSACLKRMTGNNAEGFELPMNLLVLTNNFIRNIGLPKRDKANDPEVLAGRRLFYELKCSSCHAPNFTTQAMSDEFAHLGNTKIWPYSDLLLHDMGPELADGRPDYEASGQEWRTSPLWALTLNKKIAGAYFLLHDGRARSVEEAVLWHGGEAESVKNNFAHLDQQERSLLIKFVESL